MDWSDIEMKWGEMTRRVRSAPTPRAANSGLAIRATEPAVEAIIDAPAAPAAVPTAE